MSEDTAGPARRTRRSVDVSEQAWGSDLVADLLYAYGFDHVSFNPAASFRGIEESIVNYRDNVPRVIETPHEELSVAIAHGYAKATGEPAVCLLHDAVGTLNGAMGIYNAYVDRVPVLILAGNGPLRKSHRRPWIDWIHSTLDQGALVREFTKWDDQPAHSDGVVESIVRAHNIAVTKPCGPTYVTLDHDVQENALDDPIPIPDLDRFAPPSRAAADPEAIEEAADRLVAADQPVILTDQLGDSRAAVDALVELAERLGAPVVNAADARYNFPNTHPMYLPEGGLVSEADLVLALDVWSLNWWLQVADSTTHEVEDRIGADVTLIDIGMHDVEASSLTADYYAIRETDLPILADTALAVPALRDAVAERLDADATTRDRAADRREQVAERHDRQVEEWHERAADAWDETPISVPRLAGEVWNVIEDEDWVLVNGTLRRWTHRLWDIDDYDSYIGGHSGGAGVGYGVGAAIGGALAYEDSPRIPINLQADGDLMQYMTGLWTMAHYDLPILTVVHNNRTLYNSTEHRMNLAEYRGRDASFERALIGTGLVDPVPDYAAAAEGLGVSGYGPIKDPDELAPALAAAWEDVTDGKPALVDVIAQPR